MMIEAIRPGLAERADPAKAPEMQRYMKSQMPFRGVQKPARVQLARAVFVDLTRAEWERVVLTLWREAEFREERYMALAVLRDRRYRAYRTMDALPQGDRVGAARVRVDRSRRRRRLLRHPRARTAVSARSPPQHRVDGTG